MANPAGEKVIAGSAAFQRNGSTLTVTQGSDKAIVNWQSFSIGAGELTRFVQPSASSAILNRVVSGNPSALLGRLEANGKVFLINPNGILVGGGAVINTNGFIASTRDIPNAQFLADGVLKFVGDSKASIQNLGTIRAESGDVFLIAHSVENAGSIEAPRGSVGLAAGSEVLLKHAGDERLFVQATVSPGPQSDTGVENSGVIEAVKAELRAAGGNVYALAVNNKGVVHATGIAERNGRVYLTSAGGTVQSSGSVTARNSDGTGGSVVMTGARVGLAGTGTIDVSGEKGGGTALVGGDFRGGNPGIENSQLTLVGRGTRIDASAGATGDGGRVIVWSDGTTIYDGAIAARGGANSGNGGFAEVSGKEALGFTGTADLGAAAGARGTLLLDPKNVRMRTGGTATPAEVSSFSNAPDQERTVDPAQLALTNANVELQANNDIFLESSLQLVAPDASFTARAGRNILVDAGVTIGTNNGAVTLVANERGFGEDPAQRDPGAGVISMHGLSAINSGGADVTLRLKQTPDALNANQFITVSTITAGAGTITLQNEGAASNPLASSVTQVGNGLTAARLDVSSPGQINLASPANNVARLLVSNSGFVLYNNAAALIVGDEFGGRAPSVGASDVTIQTSAGNITVEGGSGLAAGGLSGSLTYDAAGALVVNRGLQSSLFSPSVNVIYRAANDVTIRAPLIRARDLTVTSTGGAIAFDMPGGPTNFGVVAQDLAPAGVVTLTANGNVTSTPTSTITARSLNITSATGAIDLDGVVNATRLNATAASGGIAVDRPADNAILQFGTITSGANITINNFPAFAWGVDGTTRSTAAAGNVTVRTNTSVQFTPGSRIETGAGGLITFAAGAGQVLDGGGANPAPSFVGGNLFMTGAALGGGTTNPLDTQVSRLTAAATRTNNFGGFAFFNNNASAAGDLSIGGLGGGAGTGIVVDSRNGAGQSIQLVNNGSIAIDQGSILATNLANTAGSVVVNAMGGTSDVRTSGGFFGVAALADTALTVTAGRDVALGAGTGVGSLAARTGALQVTAGRSVSIEGNADITGQNNGAVSVTAGDAITMPGVVRGTRTIRSSGTGQVSVTANTVDLNNSADAGPVLSTNGGGISVTADTLNLNGRADAGAAGTVAIQQRTATRPISIGPENPANLSISDAELDRIAADTLAVGTVASDPNAGFRVDEPVSRPGAGSTYAKLIFRNAGAIAVQRDIDIGAALLTLQTVSGNILGGGDIRADTIGIASSTASVDLPGNIRTSSLSVNAPGGNVSLDGTNDILALTEARFDRSFRLHDNANGLVISGMVDGGATSSGRIEVRNGALTLLAGTQIIFGGANQDFRLFSDTGFINRAGGGALVPETGARWLIYAPSADAVQLGGLTPSFTIGNVAYPTVPATPGNGLVLVSAAPAPAPPAAHTPPEGFELNEPHVRAARFTLLADTVEDPDAIFNDLTHRTSLLAQLDFSLARFNAQDPQQASALVKWFAKLDNEIRDFVFKDLGRLEAKIEEHLQSTSLYQRQVLNDQYVAVLERMTSAGERLNDMVKDPQVLVQLRLADTAPLYQEVLNGLADLQRIYDAENQRRAEVARERAAEALIARAEAMYGKSVVDDAGNRIFVPRSIGIEGIQMLTPPISEWVNGRPPRLLLGGPVGTREINAIVAAGGGNLSHAEVNGIVAAGGGNFTPGVIAAIVAAGGGNLDSNHIAGIVAAGGGNIANPGVQMAIISAGIVAAGGMNLIGADGATLIGADGASLIGADGATFNLGMASQIVAAGGGNVSPQAMAQIVAAGGMNLIGADGATLIGADGASLIGADGASIVAAGGGNLHAVAAGIVAAGAGNFDAGRAAQIVAAGAGNFQQTLSGIVAAGAGNFVNSLSGIVAAGAGNIVAAGAGNIVAAGAGNVLSHNGAQLAGGSGFVNSNNLVSNPAAGIVNRIGPGF